MQRFFACIKASLEAQGWKTRADRTLKTLVNRFVALEEMDLPWFEQQFLATPRLIMYQKPMRTGLLILRLWNSGDRFVEES